MELESGSLAACPRERAEIRVLGPLRVRRPDGDLVAPSTWRTRKTMDLLRLLALRVGQPVPVGVLVGQLWPDASEVRGRASLRTSASIVRGVLGRDSLARHLDGLVLSGAWVDAVAFRSLAAEARGCLREGLPERAVAVTREAEALYLDDLRCEDDTAQWAVQEREQLAGTLGRLLEDAAEAAAALGRHREAVDLARRVVLRDPGSERAARTVMASYAALGEVQLALREYGRCRAFLVQELGVDPSPATQALHLAVLRGELAPAPPREPPFVGRTSTVARLRAAVRAALDSDVPALLELHGAPGSGRRRVLAEVAAGAGVPLRLADPPRPGGTDACGATDGEATDGEATDGEATDGEATAPAGAAVGVAPAQGAAGDVLGGSGPAVHLVDGRTARRLLDSGPPPPGTVLAVLTDPAGSLAGRARQLGWAVTTVALSPMTAGEAAELVGAVVGDRPAPALVDDVVAEVGGQPAAVVGAARELVASGRLRSTGDGLVRLPSGGQDEHPDTHRVLARALEQLPVAAQEVMTLLAVIDVVVPSRCLLPALGDGLGDAGLREALDALHDSGLLVSAAEGVGLRDPALAAAVRGWLRPSARRALHRRVAERVALPAARRVGHWLRADEPRLACAAALDAVSAALDAGDDVEAGERLRTARALGELVGSDPADLADLAEQYGDVCLRLGSRAEAAESYDRVLRDLRGAPPATRHRLTAKRDAALREGAVTPRRSPARRAWGMPELVDEIGLPPDGGPSDEVEECLHAALQEVRRAGGAAAGDREAGLRVLLAARVHVPRRQLAQARALLAEVPSLTSLPDLVGRAVLVQRLPEVLLGHAGAARAPVRSALADAHAAGDVQTAARLRTVALLCQHDLDPSPVDAASLAAAAAAAGAGFDWLPPRVLAESGRAAQTTPASAAGRERRPPLLAQLHALVAAEVQLARGRPHGAMAVLRAAVEDAVGTGCRLLLPELAARLVALEYAEPDGWAQDDVDLMEWALGPEPAHPRELCLQLVALARVRARHGGRERALPALERAGLVAAEYGLRRLAGQVEQACRELGTAAGVPVLPRPRATAAAVAELF